MESVDEKFMDDQMHSCFAILTEEPGNTLSKHHIINIIGQEQGTMLLGKRPSLAHLTTES